MKGLSNNNEGGVLWNFKQKRTLLWVTRRSLTYIGNVTSRQLSALYDYYNATIAYKN